MLVRGCNWRRPKYVLGRCHGPEFLFRDNLLSSVKAWTECWDSVRTSLLALSLVIRISLIGSGDFLCIHRLQSCFICPRYERVSIVDANTFIGLLVTSVLWSGFLNNSCVFHLYIVWVFLFCKLDPMFWFNVTVRYAETGNIIIATEATLSLCGREESGESALDLDLYFDPYQFHHGRRKWAESQNGPGEERWEVERR